MTGLQRKTELKRTPFKRKRTASKTDFTPSAKREMERRSGGRCEARTDVCHVKAVLFHHILRRTQGGKGTAENGMHLCLWCHEWIHSHTAESYALGWLARRVDS